jgi:uncharacterized membrane protein YkoI
MFKTTMKTFTQIKVGLVAATVVLALALPAIAGEKEGKKKKEIKLGDCPAAVQQTIKDNAGGGEILEVEKATKKDGAVVYEAEVKKTDGKKVEVKVAADGKLLKVEDADEENDQDNNKDGGQDDDKDN